MQANRRRKRAAVEDIYATGCNQPGGYCPPDVKNKVEQNTWADFLLKVFGSVVYFGGLGIGTGKGTGGSTGYTPLGGTAGSRGTASTLRPSIPLDTLGAPDLITVDPIAPESSAIVPLAEGLPEPGVIDTGTTFPGLSAENENVLTVLDPLSEVTGVGEHPNIITGGTDDIPAVLDVQTSPPPAKKIILDPTLFQTKVPLETHASHVDANLNLFVDAQSFGTHVGFTEEIPLEEINLRSEFEIEDNEPKTSTPFGRAIASKTKQLYNKYIQQVPTRPAEFARYTSRFEFENPAFEEDVTIEFENDLAEIEQITTPALSDVRILNRPIYSETADRTVRISRLGQRAGMKTRSGLEIGQRVHFYLDLSDIPRESIELNTFGNYSHESTIVDEMLSSTFINPFEMPVDTDIFAESELLDPLEEDFRDSHIVVPYLDDEETAIVPTLPPGLGLKVYSDLSETDLLIHYPVQPSNILIPEAPYIPLGPADGVIVDDNDYFLHPSLYPKKRKRTVL